MAKYKLTITDMETGKVEIEEPCDGIVGAGVLRGSCGQASPISFVLAHMLSPANKLSMVISLDDAKGQLLKHPVVAFGYANKYIVNELRPGFQQLGLHLGAE